MSLEILIATIATTTGLSSIIYAAIKAFFLKRKSQSITISMKDGRKVEVAGNISTEDLDKLITRLREIDDIDIELKKVRSSINESHRNQGFVSNEFLLYLVPGIIALLFAGTFIYLLIANQSKPDYTTPKELSSAMTMIIGYFFGVGVSSAANKSKTLSEDDIQKIIDANN